MSEQSKPEDRKEKEQIKNVKKSQMKNNMNKINIAIIFRNERNK